MDKEKKFRIWIRCIQEMEMVLPASAYETDDPNKIAEIEEQNVLTDPSFFDFNEDSIVEVICHVEEVKDV